MANHPLSKQTRKRLDERKASLRASVAAAKQSKRDKERAEELIEELLTLLEHAPVCRRKTSGGKRYSFLGSPDKCPRCLIMRMKNDFTVNRNYRQQETMPLWLKASEPI